MVACNKNMSYLSSLPADAIGEISKHTNATSLYNLSSAYPSLDLTSLLMDKLENTYNLELLWKFSKLDRIVSIYWETKNKVEDLLDRTSSDRSNWERYNKNIYHLEQRFALLPSNWVVEDYDKGLYLIKKIYVP